MKNLYLKSIGKGIAFSKLILVGGVMMLGGKGWGQTNPTAQALPYSQDFSSLASTSTFYPNGWQGWQIGAAAGVTFRTNAPTADVGLTASSSASINSGGVHNYNGKIGLLASGSIDPALCLSITTSGLFSISVGYDIMTIRNPHDGSANTRINECTLQYRVGTSGTFTLLTGIEYQNNTTTQTGAGVTTPQNSQSKSITLPVGCENQAVVQLRWVQRDVSGAGSRPSFAMDNINVSSSAVGPTLPTDYFRSSNALGGTWNTTAHWQSSPDNGVTPWVTSALAPDQSAASILIRSGYNITSSGTVTADDITIEAGATLTISGGTFTVNNGAAVTDLLVNGTLTVSGGTFTNSGAGINFAGSSTYTHAINAGVIPTATWNASSNCNITGMAGTAPSGFGQSFGNFNWNCNGQTAFANVNNGLFSTQGILSVTASGASSGLTLNTGATSLTYGFGSINITGGILQLSFLASNGTVGLTTVKVSGNVAVVSPGTLDLGYDLSGANPVTGGIYVAILEIGGDLGITGASPKFRNSGANYSLVLFSKNGAQTYTCNYLASTNINYGIDYAVAPSSILSLVTDMTLDGTYEGQLLVSGMLNSGGQIIKDAQTFGANIYGDFYLNGNSTITPTGTVTSGSNIITSVSSLTGVVNGKSISGTGIPANTFIVDYVLPNKIVISNNATSSVSGITLTITTASKLITSINNGITALPGPGGAVQVKNIRSYSSTSDYEFQGNNTGDFSNATTPTLNTIRNLTINKNTGVTLTSNTRVNGALNLTLGTFTVPTLTTLTIAGTVPSPVGNIDASTGATSTIALENSGFTLNAAVLTPSGTVSNLINNPGVGNTNTLNGSFTIAKSLTLTSGTLANGNNTLTLGSGGSVEPILPASPTGKLSLGSTASLIFNGSGQTATIPDNVFSSAPVIKNLTANRGYEVKWNNQGLQLTGVLTLTSGSFNIGAGTLDLNDAALVATAGTLSGTSILSSASSLTVRGSIVGIVTIPTTAGIGLKDVTVSGTRTLALNGTKDLTLNGTMNIGSTAIFDNGGESQIILNGTPSIIINGKFITRDIQGFFGTNTSIPTIVPTLNPDCTIEYALTGNQAVQSTSIQIPVFYNLILSGSGSKVPSSGFDPIGTVTIKENAIFDCTGKNVGNASTHLTMTDNSRLIVSTTSTNPSMAGNYNLTGGVVQFDGSNLTAQTIRTKTYQNIEVTGNNVGNSSGNITLNDLGTFKVKNGGIFSINDNNITGPTGTQTVTVENGGIIKSGNNEGFHGFTATFTNNSSISSTIENIVLNTGSTVEYSRGGDQPITNSGGLIYQNLTISGTGIKTAPSATLTVQGDMTKAGTSTYDNNSGLVLLNGTNQSFDGFPFYALELTNGIKTSAGNSTIADKLKINASTNLTLAQNKTITILSTLTKTASVAALGAGASITYAGTAPNKGKFIVERFIRTPRKWQLLSVPTNTTQSFRESWQENFTIIAIYGTHITDNNSGTIIPNGFDAYSAGGPSIKTLDLNSNTWVGIPNVYTGIKSDYGYMTFVRGDRSINSPSTISTTTTLRTMGELYVGDKTINLSTAGFAHVGNPYASAVKLFDVTKINLAGAEIYIWDPTLGGAYQVGAYRTLTPDGSGGYLVVPNGGNYVGPWYSIESGQAFFVRTNAGGSLTFHEADKLTGSMMVYGPSRLEPNVRADILAKKNTTYELIDGCMARFDNVYSNEVNDGDALKFNNSTLNVSLQRDSKFLSIERRKTISSNDTLFLNVSGLTVNSYQWQIPATALNAVGRNGFLIDNFTGRSFPLNLDDTNRINFTVENVAESYAPNRFMIVFTQDRVVPVSITSISANRNADKSISVNWKVENEINISKYDIERSADGRAFTSIANKNALNNNGTAAQYIQVDATPLNYDNFYRIKATSYDGQVQYSAIVKVSPLKQDPSLSVYPNPVKDKQMHVQFTAMPAGNYNLQLAASNGQVIYKTNVLLAGNSQAQTILLQAVAAGDYILTLTAAGREKMVLKVVVE